MAQFFRTGSGYRVLHRGAGVVPHPYRPQSDLGLVGSCLWSVVHLVCLSSACALQTDRQPVFHAHAMGDGRTWFVASGPHARRPHRLGVQTFGHDAWTLGIWSAIFVFGMLRYFTYIAMRIHEQNDERLEAAAALAREEERRRLGLQLAQLERQQSLGVMSASFAHELNQPLGVILNYAELLQHQQRSGTMEPAMTLSVLDDIIASTLRATEIIRRIRLFIQPTQTLKHERFDMRTVVENVLALAGPQALLSAITVAAPTMPEPIWVRADPVLMSQVLFNVLRNAMDSMVNSVERRILLDISQNTEDVHIAVTDSGHGLTTEGLQKAGDPFYSTKISGMGLGLSISKSILAQYGGHLSLTNTDKGVRALIRIPKVQAI